MHRRVAARRDRDQKDQLVRAQRGAAVCWLLFQADHGDCGRRHPLAGGRAGGGTARRRACWCCRASTMPRSSITCPIGTSTRTPAAATAMSPTARAGNSRCRSILPKAASRRARTLITAWKNGSAMPTTSCPHRMPRRAGSPIPQAGWWRTNARSLARPTTRWRKIEHMLDVTGGFGGVLVFAQDWANWQATQRSLELIAEEVRPKLNGSNRLRQASYDRNAPIQDANRALAQRRHRRGAGALRGGESAAVVKLVGRSNAGENQWHSFSTANGVPRTFSSTTTTRDFISSARRFSVTASAAILEPRFPPNPAAITSTARWPARGRTAQR